MTCRAASVAAWKEAHCARPGDSPCASRHYEAREPRLPGATGRRTQGAFWSWDLFNLETRRFWFFYCSWFIMLLHHSRSLGATPSKTSETSAMQLLYAGSSLLISSSFLPTVTHPPTHPLRRAEALPSSAGSSCASPASAAHPGAAVGTRPAPRWRPATHSRSAPGKKLLGTSASLVVTSALLVVTRSY